MKMKFLLNPLTALACAAALIPHAACAEEPPAKPLSAAVLNFQAGSADLESIGTSISGLLQVQLSVHSDAILVERAELNEVLAEQELTLSNAVTPEQAARVAQLTGAEVIISGRVFAVEDRVHLVAKVISTSTSRVFGATTAYDKGKPLDEAIASLGQEVAKILSERAADLRGGASLDQRVIAKMKALMVNRAPGKIYIHIPEAIIQAVVPDPAAETELARTFQQAGWQVVESPEAADLVVRGEAFAETGVRRGNLWFTRARLEIKVYDGAQKVLLTDRVVAGNVDLTQAVSAKGALQRAGLLASEPALNAWIATAKNAE
jgi:hypothetical protein